MSEWVIQYWVEWAFGILAALLLASYRSVSKRLKVEHERQIAMEEGMQAMLRAQIINEYNKWIDRGYYPIYARENMDFLSKAYFKLKGNGVVPDLLKALSPLPTDPPRKDEEEYDEH